MKEITVLLSRAMKTIPCDTRKAVNDLFTGGVVSLSNSREELANMQIFIESNIKMMPNSENNYNFDSKEGKRRIGFDLLN